MRKTRFTDERMVAILREADREPVAAVAKRHAVSEQTIYTWRERFGGLRADEVRRLKARASALTWARPRDWRAWALPPPWSRYSDAEPEPEPQGRTGL
jgi:transposase